MRNLLFAAILALAAASSAGATGFKVDLRYIGNLTIPPAQTAGIGWLGGGAGLEVLAGSHVGFRLGANYLQRSFNGLPAYGVLDIPLDLNFHPFRWFVLGAGGFFNYSFTNPSSLKNLDYGASATLGFVIPLGRVGIELGGRYLFNFANIANSGAVINPHEIEAYLGLLIRGGGGAQ
ncbi:MAG: hypothetical protein ACXWPM_11920 [Bdellovibrionota bacterium]